MSETSNQNDEKCPEICRCESSRLLRDAWQQIARLVFRLGKWCKKIFKHLLLVKRYHLSHIILWCFVISSFLLNFFFIFFHLRFCHYLSDIGLKILRSPESTSYNDSYTGNVVNFYQTLVTIQFSVIAVLLVLCFVFTYTVSRRQIRETVQDELKSEYFLKLFSDNFLEKKELELSNMLTAKINDCELASNIESVESRLDDIESEIEGLKESKQDREENILSPDDNES